MGDKSEKPWCKHPDDVFISTEKELVAYLEANPDVVSEIARYLAGYFGGDGQVAVREILESGYEHFFDDSDTIDKATSIETIVATPCIKIGTEWIRPLEDMFYGIPGMPKDIVIDHGLETDFGHILLWMCLNLIEEKGKSKPDSTSLDIVDQKVSECFRRILIERQSRLEEERESEDAKLQRVRAEEDSALGRVIRGREGIPGEMLAEDYLALRRIKDFVSREVARVLGEMWEVSGGGIRRLTLDTDVRAELQQLWQMGEALNEGLEVLAVQEALWQVHQKMNNMTGSGNISYQLRRTEVVRYNREAFTRLLQQQRTEEDLIRQYERAEEDENIFELYEATFRDAINDAVPLIGEWMEETIKAEGDTLVLDALRLL